MSRLTLKGNSAGGERANWSTPPQDTGRMLAVAKGSFKKSILAEQTCAQGQVLVPLAPFRR